MKFAKSYYKIMEYKQPRAQQSPNHERLHSMDALRAIAMLLGIVLHAIIPYRTVIQDTWPSDDSFHSFFF